MFNYDTFENIKIKRVIRAHRTVSKSGRSFLWGVCLYKCSSASTGLWWVLAPLFISVNKENYWCFLLPLFNTDQGEKRFNVTTLFFLCMSLIAHCIIKGYDESEHICYVLSWQIAFNAFNWSYWTFHWTIFSLLLIKCL